MISLERYQRYLDKINLCESRIVHVKKWMSEDNKELKTILATYKGIQEIIESLTDIISMILKDNKSSVNDDYTNFKKIVERGILNKKDQSILDEANGLRNRLIHNYNGIDDEMAINSFKTLLPSISNIIELLNKWIQKNLKQ